MQLNPGHLLQGGKYKIIKPLGQGGFGITYLAEQTLMERKVCIKEFFMKEYCDRDEATNQVSLGATNNKAMMEKYQEKFLKEARMIARLDHPNIIRIFDVFTENNTAYYVMEYIEGKSLNELVKESGALPEAVAIEYVRQIGEGLAYVHDHNINHLDIKPGNILVRKSDNRPILIDFGMSKQYDESGDQTSSTPLGISEGYAPLEMYRIGGVSSFSPQTDIYELGATLYRLVTGKVPPTASDVMNEGLPEMPAYLSDSTKSAIEKAMGFRKRSRPDSMSAFISLLSPASMKVVEKGTVSMTNVKSALSVAVDDSETIIVEKQIDSDSVSVHQDEVSNKDAMPSILDKEDISQENAEEQLRRATAFYYGQGVKQDIEEAARCYRRAAEQGLVLAQSNLGKLYYYGLGVQKDLSEAVKWYRRAAEQGHAEAQNALGNCYFEGEGVSKDYSESVKWYRKAAGQGNVEAQNRLGNCFYLGQGVPKDVAEAAVWYHRAADQGFAPAQYNYGRFLFRGPQQNEAVRWWREAAEQGEVNAQCDLAICYLRGLGVAQDEEEGWRWLYKAKAGGHPDANRLLESGWARLTWF